MALFLVVNSVSENFIQELRHVKVIDILIDKFDNGKNTCIEVAKDVHQRFQIILTTSCEEINHAIRCKKRIAVEALDFLLLLVLTILVEYFCDKSKVNDRVLMRLFIIANVLEF